MQPFNQNSRPHQPASPDANNFSPDSALTPIRNGAPTPSKGWDATTGTLRFDDAERAELSTMTAESAFPHAARALIELEGFQHAVMTMMVGLTSVAVFRPATLVAVGNTEGWMTIDEIGKIRVRLVGLDHASALFAIVDTRFSEIAERLDRLVQWLVVDCGALGGDALRLAQAIAAHIADHPRHAWPPLLEPLHVMARDARGLCYLAAFDRQGLFRGSWPRGIYMETAAGPRVTIGEHMSVRLRRASLNRGRHVWVRDIAAPIKIAGVVLGAAHVGAPHTPA